MNTALSRLLLLSAIALTPFSTLTPQQASQTQRVPQFENENVAVWKTTVMPDAPLTLHTHEHPRVIIALSGGTVKVMNEDGTSELHPWDTGKAYWLSAEEGKKRHADANTGSRPIEVMVVELKKVK